MAPDRRVLFVHGEAAGDQRDHSAEPDNVKALGEKVVVYGLRQVRTSAVRRIEHRIIAKRDISDGRVEEISGWAAGTKKAGGA